MDGKESDEESAADALWRSAENLVPSKIKRLRAEWRPEMSMPTLIALRDKLDEMLHQIRTVGHIQTPIITCPKCGKTGPSAEPRVSVRAMILALARFEIAPRDQAKALENAWAKYREEHQLDIEGKALSTARK
jgi:hypothetical protein